MPVASQLALVGVFSIILIINAQPVFADKVIQYDKVLNIPKESLESVFQDLDNLPKIFPGFVESVESTNTENRKVAKVVINLNGFRVYPLIEYSNPANGIHTMQVISGQLKDTKINIKLEKTWDFNGVANRGTIAHIDLNLKNSGFASFFNLFSDEAVLYSIDRFLIDTVYYASSDYQIENNDEIMESEFKPLKRGHKKR